MFAPRYLLRRLARQRLVTLSLLGGLVLAVALGVAVPLATNALAGLGLRATLAALPPITQQIQLSRTGDPFDAGLRRRLKEQLGDLVARDYTLTYTPLLNAHRDTPTLDFGLRLRAQEGMFDRITVDGATPQPQTGRIFRPNCAATAPLEALLGAEQGDIGLQRGDTLCLGGALPLKIVGVWQPTDRADPYWFADFRALRGEVASGGAGGVVRVAQLVLQPTDLASVLQIFSQPGVAFRPTQVYRALTNSQTITIDRLLESNTRLQEFRTLATNLQPRPTVLTGLDRAISTFSGRFRLLQSALAVLLCEVVTLALLYVVLVGTLATEQQSGELAILRSRGSSGRQLLLSQLAQAVVLIVPSVALGLVAGTGMVVALRQAAVFRSLQGQAGFELRFTPSIAVAVAVIALVALVALLWAARPALAQSLVTLRQERARPPRRAGLLQLQRDAVLVLLAAAGWWQLRRYGGGLTTTLAGDEQFNLLVLAAPALLLLAGALVFLRLFPLLVRGWSLLVGRRPGLVGALSAWQLARNPVPYGRLVLLLTLTVGLGVYSQAVSTTISRAQLRQALDEAGADLTIALEPTDDANALAAEQHALARTVLLRTEASVLLGSGAALQKQGTTALVGVDGSALAEVLQRSGSDDAALLAALPVLSGVGQPALGLPLPPSATALTVEARGATTNLTVYAKIAGINGVRQVALGQPGSAWQPLRAALPADLQRPLALQGLIIVPNGDALGTASGGVFFDQISTVADTTSTKLAAFDPLAQWEATGSAANAVNVSASEGSSNRLGARLTFGTLIPGRWVALRWRIQATLPVYTSVAAGGVRAASGQTIQLQVGDQRLSGLVQGQLASLPGLGDDRRNVVVADQARLVALLSYGTPLSFPATELRLALPTGAAPAAPPNGASKAAALRIQAADPLGNGVRVILLLGALSAVILSVLGFVTYTALTLKARALEWAVLRAMGLAPRQQLLLIAAEQSVVLAGGVIIGTLVGLLLTTTTRPFLQVVTRSELATPVTVGWGGLLVTVGGLLLALLVALALLLVNVQRQGLMRNLRLGETS